MPLKNWARNTLKIYEERMLLKDNMQRDTFVREERVQMYERTASRLFFIISKKVVDILGQSFPLPKWLERAPFQWTWKKRGQKIQQIKQNVPKLDFIPVLVACAGLCSLVRPSFCPSISLPASPSVHPADDFMKLDSMMDFLPFHWSFHKSHSI